MIMLLVAATAMALLLAGCGSSQSEDQGSRQGSEQEVGSSEQTPEPTTDERVVVHCADSDSTGGQQEEAGRGDVSNGKIVFTRSTDVPSSASNIVGAVGDIYVVDEEGTHETKLTCTKQLEEDPIWSPDGQKIAYLTTGPSGFGMLHVMNADGTNRIRLPEGNLAGAVQGGGAPAWSPDGQKIVFVEIYSGDLYVINADGTNEARLTTLPSGYSEDATALGSPAWSPDGKRIAFARGTVPDTSTASAESSTEPASASAEGLNGIYLINVDGTGLRKLTSLAGERIFQEFEGPVWSPDGEKIAFYYNGAINVIDADGSGRKELTARTHDPPQLAWSPDGKRIAFIGYASELNVINADGSGQRSLTNAPGLSYVLWPTWSPDSQKLAFSCPPDLCVINVDGTGLKRIATEVSTEEGEVTPSWGRE
jgi:Tol biopolymer transport system component